MSDDVITGNVPSNSGQVPAYNWTTVPYVNSQVNPLFDLDVDGHTRVKGDLVIEDDAGEVTNVGEFMKTISERLCVLQPNLEAHEHYPALKDAYEKYKMLEKLLANGKK